ncbi:uncharacterized protein [Onthophagus taurus]|uniref:uncharacterized protein isoform X2 n=1 Tax=Onthophagus taurus TaxID=166361 RepID=UPI0039BE902B
MADEVIKAACGLIANEDTQALFLIGCTCVGAYTFLRWFMQVISIIVFTIRKIFAVAFHVVNHMFCPNPYQTCLIRWIITYLLFLVACHVIYKGYSIRDLQYWIVI